MALRVPTLASYEAQQASCEAKVLRETTIIFSSEANLALSELATAPVGANLASCQVRGSLHLDFGKVTPASFSHEAEICGVVLNRTKAQARLSSKAKAKVPSGASMVHARSSNEAKAKGHVVLA